jgi:hypothetical protein
MYDPFATADGQKQTFFGGRPTDRPLAANPAPPLFG